MNVNEWLKGNEVGISFWNGKYKHNDETFEEWLDRVSGKDEEVKELIRSRKFIFGGRILANRGLQNEGKRITYSNCYVMPQVEDNIESIFDTAKILARTYSTGGGCGVDISKLRPNGATVNNAAKTTSGACSFMDIFNHTTDKICMEGRRGALMISIDVDHPDIEEFVDIKTNTDRLTKANISVKMNDRFMDKVIGGWGKEIGDPDPIYKCTFDVESTGEHIEKEVNAVEIFKKLCYNNWNFGEPGILFWDKIKNYNLLQHDDEFEYSGVNPCALV